MKKNYISPEINIDRFDICDMVLASGELPPVETLLKEGASVGDKKMNELMN